PSSKPVIRLIPPAIPLTAKRAVPVDANKIPTPDRLQFRTRAPSEIRYTLPPSASRDKEPRHSKRSRAARRVPVRLQRLTKAAHKLQAGHANSVRSQNQSA